MITVELVVYDPDDFATYPSICTAPDQVKFRFGFTGGETLVFDGRGAYIGQLVKSISAGELVSRDV